MTRKTQHTVDHLNTHTTDSGIEMSFTMIDIHKSWSNQD